MKDVLAIVLAGGEGARLQPLTAGRCKPAMPFHGKRYLGDFVLSNPVNSELTSIYGTGRFRGTADAVYQSIRLIVGRGGCSTAGIRFTDTP